MRSFALFAAILSLGASSWAAPTPITNNDILSDIPSIAFKRSEILPVVPHHFQTLDGATPSLSGKRDDTLSGATNVVQGLPIPDSVADKVTQRDENSNFEIIFVDLLTKLTPLTEQLKFVNADNATAEFVKPVIDDISYLLGDAVISVKALVGKPIEVVLCTVDGVLTTAQVAKLVADVIKLVLGAVAVVIKVAGTVAEINVVGIVCAVLTIVASLVEAVLSLTVHILDGLVDEIHDLVAEVVPIILYLNVAELISILGLKV